MFLRPGAKTHNQYIKAVAIKVDNYKKKMQLLKTKFF